MFILPYRGVPNYLSLALYTTVLIWVVAAYYNYIVIQVGCSNMAELSSTMVQTKGDQNSPYSFDSVKYRCIVEAAPQGKAFLALYSIIPSAQSLF